MKNKDINSNKTALDKPEGKQKKKEISIDTGAGSMSYNRLEMQISQALHMAIELYDSLDYLLVMDYYDDISLFENEENPEIVSYYQVKTNEDSISISTAITEDWLAKLYTQLERPEWIARELGLITNCPLKVSVSIKDETGKTKKETKLFTAEKTPFEKFNPIMVQKIKQDIAKKKGIKEEEVDLSKFAHIRTTLSIPKHKEIVEQEMGDFLHSKYPRITMDSVKTIFNAMIDIFSRRQQYELLADDARYLEVRQKKGVSKRDFERIIDEAMLISIPPFEEVQKVIPLDGEDKYKASYEYTRIMTDLHNKSESFRNVFVKVRALVQNRELKMDETAWEFAGRICEELYTDNPMTKVLYNHLYVSVLVICIIINEMRKL